MRAQAILSLAVGVTLFGVMDGIGKLLSSDYPVVQIVWARYAFALPVILAMTAPRTWPRVLRCERPWMQIWRAVLPLVASVAVVYGLSLMPLADFTAISFASPLLVVALSAPLLQERISAHSWIGVLCGFVGVLVIARPGSGAVAWAALLPVATALLVALYQVLTRLVSRADDTMATLAWTIATGVALTTPLLPFDWNPGTGWDWLLMGLSGLMFGLGQFLLIRAFSDEAAAVLAPFTYVQIVAAIVFGVAVFGDVPDAWTLVGTAVIILSGLFVLRHQTA